MTNKVDQITGSDTSIAVDKIIKCTADSMGIDSSANNKIDLCSTMVYYFCFLTLVQQSCCIDIISWTYLIESMAYYNFITVIFSDMSDSASMLLFSTLS